uniref:Protein arginine methyltransferase NDUFAF7 n=1 Tax=Ditylenchus dipsaci TaxID=166011 RepID=A0A915E1H5_9BILA
MYGHLSKNLLQRFIRDRILSGGPISVHDSEAGYYSHQMKEFGEDFITAPELCPVFGEMLALWLYNELLNTGYTGPIRLVELGPGTGLLIKDVLGVFSKLKVEQVSVHLVDVSDTCSMDDSGRTLSKTGYPVQWHRSINEIPSDAFTMFIANEFFDALPIHQFRRNSENQWREVYVNLDKDARRFCFMLSKNENIHSKTLLPDHIRSDIEREAWEVCPTAFHILVKMANRFTSHGGFALIIDYGHDGSRLTPSLRAYKNMLRRCLLKNVWFSDLFSKGNFFAKWAFIID